MEISVTYFFHFNVVQHYHLPHFRFYDIKIALYLIQLHSERKLWKKKSMKTLEIMKNDGEFIECLRRIFFLHQSINFRVSLSCFLAVSLSLATHLSLWVKGNRIWFAILWLKVSWNWENWNWLKIFASHHSLDSTHESSLTDVTIHYNFKLVPISGCDSIEKKGEGKSVFGI